MGFPRTLDRELKKGNTEMLILALLEDQPRHGYEIGKLIERRSLGALRFSIAALYPALYRMEKRGWIKGVWEEGEVRRRRRYYQLTPKGQKVFKIQRDGWRAFVSAVGRIIRIRYA